MVVQSAPIVPLHEDDGGVPEFALTDRVDERGDPRRPVSAGAVYVIGIVADRRDPREVRELAGPHVGDELPIRRDHVVLPIGPIVDVLHGLVRRPLATAAARKITVRAGVEAPREFGAVELVPERLIVVAWRDVAAVRAILRNRLNGGAAASVTAPQAPGHVDARVRLRGDDVLMGGEAFVELRLEHPVGQNPLVRHVEIRLGVCVRHVDVHRVPDTFGAAGVQLSVETVHPALRPGQRSGSVTIREHRPCRMVEHVLVRERHRPQPDRSALSIAAARHGVGAGIPLEEVIEASVLLHDVDDVRDLAGTGGTERCQSRALLQVRQRRRRARRASGERRGDRQRPPVESPAANAPGARAEHASANKMLRS